MIPGLAFDILNLKRVTTEKLAQYYAVGQGLVNERLRTNDAKKNSHPS